MTISEFLKEYPVSAKWLAERTGIDYGLIRKYSRGDRNPSADNKAKLEAAIRELGELLTKISIQ